MKTLIIILLTAFIQGNVHAQIEYSTITVAEDIELVKISENAYVHISYYDLPEYGRVPANGLIFINGGNAFLIDSPWTDSQTEVLLSWLADSMHIRVIGFIPNHWHGDCMGGLGFLQEQKIESYANYMTIDRAGSENLPVPAHDFTDSLHLRLGDEQIFCYYPGAAHSMDNIVVWIPSERILFAGCMVKSLESRNLGYTADGDLIAYPETLKNLIDVFPNAAIVIPGHGRFGGLELIEHTIDLSTK
jgi:metallo-beta-lactamase class B